MATLILRPNAAGDYANIPNQFPLAGAHWDKVNEAVPDEDARYVWSGLVAETRDVYNLGNPAIAGYPINFVTAWHRSRLRTFVGGNAFARPFLRLAGVETLGIEIMVAAAYANYSEVLARPGGGPWAWADITALQVGIGLRVSLLGAQSRCTQTWIAVDFSTFRMRGYVIG